MLNKIKECALKIFMLEAKNQYDSFSINQLQQQFKMEKAPIVKQTSKLISKGDLMAKIDNQRGNIVFEYK